MKLHEHQHIRGNWVRSQSKEQVEVTHAGPPRATSRAPPAGPADVNGDTFKVQTPGCKQSGHERKFSCFGLEEFPEVKSLQFARQAPPSRG